MVLFEEMLPDSALTALQQQVQLGFDAVLVVGTTASFGYILEPVWRVRQAGGSVTFNYGANHNVSGPARARRPAREE